MSRVAASFEAMRTARVDRLPVLGDTASNHPRHAILFDVFFPRPLITSSTTNAQISVPHRRAGMRSALAQRPWKGAVVVAR